MSTSGPRPIDELLAVMAALRDPERGCPWDLEQSFASLAPYTLEEAYEVVEAITRDDRAGLCDELGDLLFQVVFHAEIARATGAFDFDAVARGITAKLKRRHPHVFGGEPRGDRASQARRWEELKHAELRGRSAGLLDDVPLALPALARAAKLGARAARIGFDWPDAAGARSKLDEELTELDAARAGGEAGAVEHELGDLLLAACNLARHLGVDAEAALRSANRRFERRFRHVEQRATATGQGSPAQLEEFWQEAKDAERPTER